VLRAAHVDTVFGVVSIHNLPLVQAVSAALRFVPVRHEAAAVNAADGYARASGTIGCALTSTGTGAGNAAGSLIEALTAASPVLHLTGQIPSEYLGLGRGFIHETRDQTGMLASVSRAMFTVKTADAASEVLSRAVAQALGAPGGPVSVEWPIDLQYGPITTPAALLPPPSPVRLETSVIAEAANLIAAARRPVVWAGGGAARAGAQLGELVNRFGAALFTSNAGRGAVPEDHCLCVGNYAAAPAGQALLDEADVLLSLGTHFRSNETSTYQLRLPVSHIQVDLDLAALGRVYPIKVGVRGDVCAVLTALLATLPEAATDPGWPARVQQAREEVRAAQRRAIGPQGAICDAIRAVLPRTGIIARDVAIPCSSWGNRLLPVYDPRTNLFAHGGGIGQGLAMGIGAAFARPNDPVVVMVGDGGLAVHLGELLTLAQERPRLTLIVFNDGGYGVLRNIQDARGFSRAGVDLLGPDFAALANATGLRYARIADPLQAHEIIDAAVNAAQPTLVEVDVDALGAMPEVFVPAVGVPHVKGQLP
jgi:acetolactate synthase-1/2/3 large subunit